LFEKEKLTSGSKLFGFQPIILNHNASNYTVGAALSQGPVDQDQSIAYARTRVAKTLILYWIYIDYPTILHRSDVFK